MRKVIILGAMSKHKCPQTAHKLKFSIMVCCGRRISVQHSKNCGVKITPPVLIEDHTMHAFYTGVKFVVLVQHPVVLF